MELLDIHQVHEILLNILTDVDKFCRENGIKYSLAFGTLLGAHRHGGFIPWDDDADIVMMRPDFERFTISFNSESGSRFRCLFGSRKKDEFFSQGFAKVHDPQTSKYVGEWKSKFRYGISLDIFPLDAVPEDRLECHKFMHSMIHLSRRLYLRHRRFPFGPLPQMIEAHLHTLDYWWNAVNRMAETYNYEQCSHIACMIGTSTYESIHRKDLFDSLEEIGFEGKKFPAFKDVPAYLEQVYGPDYMTLPPVKDRHGHGGSIYRL